MNPVDHQEVQIGDFVIFIKNPNPAVILLGPNSSGQPPLPDSSSPPQSQSAHSQAVSPLLKMKSMSDIGGTIYDRAVQLVNTIGFGKSVKSEGLGKTLKHVWKGSDYYNSKKPSLESLNVKIDNVQASMVNLQNNNQKQFGEIMEILQNIHASPPHSPPTPTPTPTPRAIPPLLQKVNQIRGKPAEKGNGKSEPQKEGKEIGKNGGNNKQGNEIGKNGNKQGNENGKNGGNNKQGNEIGKNGNKQGNEIEKNGDNNKQDEKNGGNNKEGDEKNGGNKEAENVNQESATATKPDDDETDDDEAAASSVIIRVPKREVNESIPQYGFKVAKVVLGKVVWLLIKGGGGE